MRTRSGRVIDMSVKLAGSLLIGAACLWGATAQAGNAEEGRKIAESWCVSCHTVSGAAGARDAAPPFAVIARNPAYDRDRLLQVLSDPHPPMPKIHLSRKQLDDIIAYLGSLRPAR